MKKIKVKKDPKTGDGYIDLESLSDILDTKRVKSYTLELIDDDRDKCLLIKFYDSDGEIVNVRETAVPEDSPESDK